MNPPAVLAFGLREASDKRLFLVCGKAFKLGKMTAVALPALRGFSVTTMAFDLFLPCLHWLLIAHTLC